jgi:peptidoglycan/LPS O-acetylase OafA/YrhL
VLDVLGNELGVDEGHGRQDTAATRAAAILPAVAAGTGGREIRLDIQGLRAVAVLLVLAFHLWPETVTGGYVGVDVFFVISGFLITAHLLQHPPRRARDLLEFWGRRIRRLLPAAFLVLLVTAIASRLLAPETRWAATAGETIASALYVQNWVLAGSSVDYLAAAEPPTPVQHYWSLSVEEQFYLFWPVLILAMFWLAARFRLGGVAVARLAILAVAAVSLFVSIDMTAVEPASAYFITQTRIWELAAGGLVATLPSLGALGIRERAVDAAAWVGFAAIFAAGVLYPPDTPFPGSAALLPIAGTMLVILAATDRGRSPTAILRARPIQHLGDTSYSIYLWHWPLIVLWPYAFEELTFAGSLAIVAITIALSSITKRYVEDAYRFSPKFQPLKPTFRFALVGMLVLSLVGGAQLLEAQVRMDAALASAGDPNEPVDEPTLAPTLAPTLPPGVTPDPNATPEPTAPPTDPPTTPGPTSCVGAASMVRGFDACPQNPAAKMVPQPLAAATDRSDAYADGCWNYVPFETRITCTYGKSPVKVALVGNSHGGQWLPALQVLAKRHDWQITTYLASQCNATDAPLEWFSATKTAGCLAYGDWVMDSTKGSKYDLVIVSQRQSLRTDNDSWAETGPAATAGYSTYLQRWAAAGTKVLILRDTPFPGNTLDSVPDCLAKHPKNQPACGGTPDEWRSGDPLFGAATKLALPGVTLIDVTPYFCTPAVCPAVIGTIVAYFDASHMTATYARTIAPFIEPQILAAFDAGG